MTINQYDADPACRLLLPVAGRVVQAAVVMGGGGALRGQPPQVGPRETGTETTQKRVLYYTRRYW